MNRTRTVVSATLVMALTACGGGGDGLEEVLGGGAAEPNLISWTGSANGSTVRDADNDAIAFNIERQLVYGSRTYPGVKSSEQAQILWGGKVIGAVILADSTAGTKIAVTRCSDGTPLNLTFVDDSVSYNCVDASTSNDPPAAGAPPAASRSFITWRGSVNGDVVKDANDEDFKFFADTGCMLSVARQAETSNYCLTTPSSASGALANLWFSVASVAASGGGCITALVDRDDNLIDIYTDSLGVQTARVTSGKANRDGCSAGGESGGGSSSGSGSGEPTRSFITWNGSLNGSTVKDANNESFAFYSDTRCLYSYNRDEETSNFCLNAENTGNFAGLTIRVISVSTTGGCIVALASSDGNQVDIYTNGANQQVVQVQSTKWNVSGCTR